VFLDNTNLSSSGLPRYSSGSWIIRCEPYQTTDKDMILVVCDKLSKMTHFVATMKKTLVKGLVRLFKDNMWKLHGLPESMVSDRRL